MKTNAIARRRMPRKLGQLEVICHRRTADPRHCQLWTKFQKKRATCDRSMVEKKTSFSYLLHFSTDLECLHLCCCLYLTECGWSSLGILANTKACQVFKGEHIYFSHWNLTWISTVPVNPVLLEIPVFRLVTRSPRLSRCAAWRTST